MRTRSHLFPRLRGLAAISAAASTPLLAELLTPLPSLGNGDAAVAVRVEASETLQRLRPELFQADRRAARELTVALAATRQTLGAELCALLGGHRLALGATLGPALGTLRHALGPLRHALLDLGTPLGGKTGEAGLTPRLTLRPHRLAPGAHLLAGQAAVTIAVETGEALLGTRNRLLAGHLRSRGPLGRLGARIAGGGKQRAGDDAELDGFHD